MAKDGSIVVEARKATKVFIQETRLTTVVAVMVGRAEKEGWEAKKETRVVMDPMIGRNQPPPQLQKPPPLQLHQLR